MSRNVEVSCEESKKERKQEQIKTNHRRGYDKIRTHDDAEDGDLD